MRGLKPILTIAGTAALWCGGATMAIAHHSPGLYTGQVTGAGSGAAIEFEVSSDGTHITRFKTLNIVVSPCSFSDTEVVGVFPISGHAFSSQGAEISFTGRFDGVQKASGTVTLTPPTVPPNPPCNSGPLNWTATTTAAPPPQCQDGGDNDGDGKADHPADPGCADLADADETDPPDTTPPALAAVAARVQRASGPLLVSAACGAEACRASAAAVISIRGSSKRYKLRTINANVPAGASARLRLALSKSTRTAVRRALARGRRVSATISLTATDAAGNRARATRTVRLRR